MDLATDDIMILDTWDQVGCIPFLLKLFNQSFVHLMFAAFSLNPCGDFSHQIFLWVGKDANETERTGSPKIGKTNGAITENLC